MLKLHLLAVHWHSEEADKDVEAIVGLKGQITPCQRTSRAGCKVLGKNGYNVDDVLWTDETKMNLYQNDGKGKAWRGEKNSS